MLIELDQDIGDIHFIISDMELVMLQDLRELVLQDQHQIMNITNVLAELDCIQSLASVALENQYCRPTIVDENTIDLKNSRY